MHILNGCASSSMTADTASVYPIGSYWRGFMTLHSLIQCPWTAIGYRDAMIAAYLDDSPCSVLEMMTALAVRCEEHIMTDPDVGNRTGQWFWQMITNLGLGDMTDSKFDRKYVDLVIQRFLDRTYEPDGKGGLFTIEHCPYDLRTVEIWYQLCWYLDKLI